MPKPPRTRKPQESISAKPHDKSESLEHLSKTPAMAEIVLFPNGREAIPGILGRETDSQTKARWLKRGDEALNDANVNKRA